MSKTAKQLSIDTDKLLVKSEQSVPDQQVSTEMQVYEALRRRGIALAFTTPCLGRSMRGTFKGSFNTLEMTHQKVIQRPRFSRPCVQIVKFLCT